MGVFSVYVKGYSEVVTIAFFELSPDSKFLNIIASNKALNEFNKL